MQDLKKGSQVYQETIETISLALEQPTPEELAAYLF